MTLLTQPLVLLSLFTCIIGCRDGVSLSASPIDSFQNCESVARYAPINDTDKPVNSWLGLVPLRSTIVDVEFVYETACERVDVVYSKGACEVSEVYRYNVPANVVIRFEVALKKKIMVGDLKLGQSYVRQQESHPANWVQYRNREDGIRIHALADNKVETISVITYEPRTRDKDLECSPTK